MSSASHPPAIMFAASLEELASESGYKRKVGEDNEDIFYWRPDKNGKPVKRTFCEGCAKQDFDECEWNQKNIGGKLRRMAVEEFENNGFVNRKIRFEMYRSYTIMVHGRGATRTPLPLCVEIKIGKTWPCDQTKDDKVRTGFEAATKKPSIKKKKQVVKGRITK